MKRLFRYLTDSADNSSPAARALLFSFLLVACVLVVFGRVVTFEYLNWDDRNLIFQNLTYRPVTAESLRDIWTTSIDGMYNPLTRTFWALEAWMSSRIDSEGKVVLDPSLFHAGSLLLHLLNVVLVFVILRRLVKVDGAAFLGALLFALHPLQVEPVAWISEGKGLLCGTFCLIAIWQYLVFRATEEAGRSRTANVHYSLALCAFVLANFAKSSAVTLPLVLLILDRFWLRRRWRESAVRLGPWLFVSLLGVVAQKFLQPDQALEVHVPLWLRPIVVLDGWWFYQMKLVFPYPLFPFYDHSAKVVPYAWISWVCAILFLLTLLALSRLRNARVWLVGVGIAVAFTLPYAGLVLHAIQRVSTVQDRYMYLALLGPALCLAWFLAQCSGRSHSFRVAFVTVILLVWGAMSFVQLRIWRDDRIFFGYAVAQNPRSTNALRWLAFLEEVEGDFVEAESILRQAIAIDPSFSALHYNLGICLQSQGRYGEAIDAYREALRLTPGDLPAHQNLALAYIDAKRSAEAGEHLQFLLDAGFKEFWVQEKLGTILLETGEFHRAEQHYRAALLEHSRWSDGYANLGVALAEQNKIDEAGMAFRAALQLAPGNASIRQNLQRLEAIRESRRSGR